VKRGCDLLILIFGAFEIAEDQKIAASFHSTAPTGVGVHLVLTTYTPRQ
jgi:hypothetical protein